MGLHRQSRRVGKTYLSKQKETTWHSLTTSKNSLASRTWPPSNCVTAKAGSQGSLAVYNHLGQLWGAINADAAKQGLDIFAEHTTDARAHAGKHPNIDRLLNIAENGGEMLRIKHVFAVDDELPA